jgi:hypothetical protein
MSTTKATISHYMVCLLLKTCNPVKFFEFMQRDYLSWCEIGNGDIVVFLENIFEMVDINAVHENFIALEIKDISILLTICYRYFYDDRFVQQDFIQEYERLLSTSPDDATTLTLDNCFKNAYSIIEDCQKMLFAEDETVLFYMEKQDDNDFIWYGTKIPQQPMFAINVGVEKSRVITLKRQEKIREEREKKLKEEEELLKALENAKEVKVSKKSQTKQANKKREQEKKEREEYEKRTAIAEAERQRQLKKKQEQKKAKKNK